MTSQRSDLGPTGSGVEPLVGGDPSGLFRLTVEQAPDAIIVADRDGHVRLWNPGAEAIFGYSAAEALGRPVDFIIPEHLRSAHWAGFHRAVAAGSTRYERQPLTTLADHKGGTQFYIDLTFSILKTAEGVVGVMAVARDVTSRYLVERGLREGVLEMAFLALDPEWQITWLNEVAARLFKAAPLIGRNLWEAFPALIGTPLYEQLFRAMADHQPVHLEGFYEPLGGWVEVHAYPSPAGLSAYVRTVNQRKELEEQLRQTEKRFSLLVQQATDYAIISYDTGGLIASWNIGAERLFGFRAAEVLGKSSTIFFPPEDVARGRPEEILQLVRAQGRFEEEAWRVRKDGSRFWAEVHLSLISDAEGHPRGFGNVTRDRTEAKRAEDALRESSARVRRLIESNIIGVLISTFDGRIVEANEAFLLLIGSNRQELEAGLITRAQFTPPEAAAVEEEMLQQVRVLGRAAMHERQYLRREGSRVWALVGMARLDEETFVSFVLDVSARKQVELEKARLLEQAEEAVKARDEFLSIASHELKTPLSSLNLQLQVLQRTLRLQLDPTHAPAGTRLPTPEMQLRMIESSVQQSKGLATLLDELLDITRIRLGRIQLHPQSFELAALIRDAVNRFQPAATQAGSELTAKTADPIVGSWDRVRIEQVVNNLISNAIKYGEGRPIEVSAALVNQGSTARLTVRDQGMGIPPGMEQRIFERFERVSTTTRIPGLGLGLYIARQIIEAHGGAIRVESAPLQGSTFIVELPVRAPPT